MELVQRLGNKEQQREAISKTQVWLHENPNNPSSWYIRSSLLYLGIKQATLDEKKAMIEQAHSWLNNHGDNRYIRTPYLILVNKYGTTEQKVEALSQTIMWLKKYPDDFGAHVQYIILIIKVENPKYHRDTIANLSRLLDDEQPLEDSYMLSHYLKLVRLVGLDEERGYALNQISNWLDLYFDSYVLAEYLELLQEGSNDIQELRRRIGQWWEWIVQQEKVDARIWYCFLKILYQKASRDLWKKPVNLALSQHPNDIHILKFILQHFREILDNDTKHLIQFTINQITSSKLS